MLTNVMGDMRHTNEMQMTVVRPHCHRCFRSGRLPGVDLVVCPTCNCIAVCKDCLGGEEITPEAMHRGGKEECELYLIYLCCSGMIVEKGQPLTAACDTNSKELFLPKDWLEYFAKKGSDFDRGVQMRISILRNMAPVTCFLTDGLTTSLTIQMLFGKLNMTNKSTLTIHILGGDSTEVMHTRLFVEIGRHNPQLKHLDIVIIGPNLPEIGPWAYSSFTLPNEMPCHLNGKVEYQTDLYHKSRAADDPLPDLCVAFNSGIDDPSYFSNWIPTLALLNRRAGSPFCIIGFNHLEVVNATKKLKKIGFHEKVPPSPNPFRSMRPFLDPAEEESSFAYCNAAYAILEGSG